MVGRPASLKYLAMASSNTTEQGSRGARAEVSACVCTSMATSAAGSILGTYLLIDGPLGCRPDWAQGGRDAAGASDAQKRRNDKARVGAHWAHDACMIVIARTHAGATLRSARSKSEEAMIPERLALAGALLLAGALQGADWARADSALAVSQIGDVAKKGIAIGW